MVAPIVIQSLDKWIGIAAFNDDIINECKTTLLQSIVFGIR
ncbi:hypothetical protein VCR17J2_340092 [Vibrio coralliirubri]|nr:hypothetical protein VCR17J2_340092 [Vibrio coralliirubri]